MFHKHLMNKSNISETFISTWDPHHKIGVIENQIRKDKDFVWLVDLTALCQDIYGKFNWGKNYQALVEMCDYLGMKMRHLKKFSTTRLPTVLDQFLILL